MRTKHLFLLFIACAAASYAYSTFVGRKVTAEPATIVILSTNDMHAQIQNFGALATAIDECRDTVATILVDAGDKWTGNAYVDRVEHYAPMFSLMNHVGYDLGIYGNHEFDKGQAYLAESNKLAEFEILGANIKSDTSSFPQPPAFKIIEREGIRIGFVGVVGNYNANNCPAGFDASFAGLTFSDPQQTATKYAYLKDECDVLILVTHMGLERDREFLESSKAAGFDMVIGAHSHDKVDEVINGRPLGQGGSRLSYLGATVVKRDKEGKISLDYRNVPLNEYAKDSAVSVMVEGYLDNADLKREIAKVKEGCSVEFMGIANLFLESMLEATEAELSFYNRGGIRISQLPSNSISLGTVLNMEPFNNYLATIKMTTAQMERMILTKFNDTVNVGESHSIDLICSVPYTVLTDANGDGVSVEFEGLNKERAYTVVMGGYIFSTYSDVEGVDGAMCDILAADAISNHLESISLFVPDNRELQQILQIQE